MRRRTQQHKWAQQNITESILVTHLQEQVQYWLRCDWPTLGQCVPTRVAESDAFFGEVGIPRVDP